MHGKVEKMLAIGKKKRPAVGGVHRKVQFRERSRSASIHVDLRQRRDGRWGKYNNAAWTPCAATPELGITKRLRRSAVQLNGPHLAVSKESDRTAVRRPERKNGIARIGQCASLGTVHGANP